MNQKLQFISKSTAEFVCMSREKFLQVILAICTWGNFPAEVATAKFVCMSREKFPQVILAICTWGNFPAKVARVTWVIYKVYLTSCYLWNISRKIAMLLSSLNNLRIMLPSLNNLTILHISGFPISHSYIVG